MYEDDIQTHEDYLDYMEHCYSSVQRTNAYRILSFLKYGNKQAVQEVSHNPETSMTAYYSVAGTKRWAGIITGKDMILLLADNDLVDKYKEEIEAQNLKSTNMSWNRGAIIIPTTKDGGMIDKEGNLTLDMQFVVDFAQHCLSDDTPPFGMLG